MGINKNLYRKDVYRNRRGLIIWSIILIGITLMVLAIFPIMANFQDEMMTMMEGFSSEMNDSMGYSAEMWSSILNFYSTYYGVYIVMLMSIFSTTTATNIIAKEERNQTSEFLYTKPIARKEVFWSKFMVLLTVLGIVFVIQTAIAFGGIQLFKTGPIDVGAFFIMNVHGLILAFFFTCVGLFASVYMRPKKNFMGVVLGLIFGMFFLDAISKVADSINWLGYISPFHYMGFGVMQSDFTFNTIPAIVLLALAGTLVFLSLQKFKKKDILG
ncbi:MAG: ABC transporter permease subunit [Flavobacteriales bacterium]|nr:ABC transporter permease subunit [Flavobacteriales bacterium]